MVEQIENQVFFNLPISYLCVFARLDNAELLIQPASNPMITCTLRAGTGRYGRNGPCVGWLSYYQKEKDEREAEKSGVFNSAEHENLPVDVYWVGKLCKFMPPAFIYQGERLSARNFECQQ